MDNIKMIIDTVEALQFTNKYEAYLKLISMIGTYLNVSGTGIEQVSLKEKELIESKLDLKSIKDNVNDWFTLALEEENIITKMSKKDLDLINKDIKTRYTGRFMAPLFIPYQGGRLMVDTFKIAGRNALYMCVEPDLLLYRIALVNSKLYDIPSLILNLDHTKANVRIYADSWNKANKWTIESR